MPSPVGHAFGAMAAGWSAAGRGPYPHWISQAVIFSAVGVLPDIDLLFGAHSGPTHSIGAALIVTILAWGVSGYRARPGIVLAVFAAYSSHIVLDWLGADTSPPLGVMALWPFSTEYFMSPVPLMPAISRRYWLPDFWSHNLRALAIELAIFTPLLLAVWWGRGVKNKRRKTKNEKRKMKN